MLSSHLSTPLPVLLMRLLSRRYGGVVLGKHKRGKITVCHVSYILPPTTIAGDLQRQILGCTDLCVTSHRSYYHLCFFVIEKASHFHTESGDSFRQSWAFLLIVVSSRHVFPYSAYGNPCVSVKSFNKVKIPHVYCFFSYTV